MNASLFTSGLRARFFLSDFPFAPINLPHEINRPLLALDVCPAQVFAEDAGAQHLEAAEEEDEAEQRGVARHVAAQDERAGGRRLPTFRTTVTRHENSAVRVDGNNVVMEEEQAELWKTYAQYSYLLDRVGGHYRNINTAITNMRR